MSLRLHACYDAEPHEGPLSPFYVIDGNMSDNALAHFIDRLHEYGRDYDIKADDLRSQIDAMIQRDFLILGGELAAIIDNVHMRPGCCVGVEGWRQWKYIKPGGGVPWLGHDDNVSLGESYWIEAKPDYLLFTKPRKKSKDLKIRASYADVSRAVDAVEQDLKAFLKRLGDWLREQGISDAHLFTKKLDHDFEINKARPKTNT